MLKFVVIGCLCAVVLVEAQMGQRMGPDMMNSRHMQASHSRMARQSGPPQGGMPGNLGMQGLGNIPDPTAIIAKAQEVGRQFLSGRRRRQAPSPEDAAELPEAA